MALVGSQATHAPREHHAKRAVEVYKASLDNGNDDVVEDNLVEVAAYVGPEVETTKEVAGATKVEGLDLTVPLGDVFSLEKDNTPLESVSQPSDREKELDALVSQLREENSKLSASREEEFTKSSAVLQELEELRSFKKERELEKKFALDNLEFDTLDPAQVQEIHSKVLRPMLSAVQTEIDDKYTRQEEKLLAERSEREKLQSDLSDREVQNRRERSNRKIYQAIPDFDAVRNTPAFERFMGQPLEGSSKTIGEWIAYEYTQGNHEFVINKINQFKSGYNKPEVSASAPVSTTATAPANSEPEDKFSAEDLAEMNNKRATGQISNAEYREFVSKYKAAKKTVN